MKRFRYSLILFLILWVAGCTAMDEDPQLIASYPSTKQIGTYPVAPRGLMVVYNAELVIEVLNVNRATEKATNIACEYSGYLVSSRSWYQDGNLYTTLVLAMPVVHFDKAHRGLLSLGDLVSERVTGDLQPPGYGEYEWETFSHITLHLHPKKRVFPSLRLPDWRPLHTLSKALSVAGTILGFILDILIWVGVVAGPFVLAGWTLMVLYRRRKRKLVEKADDE